jgi:hypothetical protein
MPTTVIINASALSRTLLLKGRLTGHTPVAHRFWDRHVMAMSAKVCLLPFTFAHSHDGKRGGDSSFK